MRELLKNKELRRELITCGAAAVLAGSAALWEPAAGLFVLAAGVVFLLPERDAISRRSGWWRHPAYPPAT